MNVKIWLWRNIYNKYWKKPWYCIYRYINIVKFTLMYNLKAITITLLMVGNIMKCALKFTLSLTNVHRALARNIQIIKLSISHMSNLSHKWEFADNLKLSCEKWSDINLHLLDNIQFVYIDINGAPKSRSNEIWQNHNQIKI